MSIIYEFYPTNMEDLTVYYTVIDPDPLEIEIQSLTIYDKELSEPITMALLEKFEDEWIREILEDLMNKRRLL